MSKILTGDLSVDLFDHLREFKRRPNASVEKKRVELSVELIVYRKRALGIK